MFAVSAATKCSVKRVFGLENHSIYFYYARIRLTYQGTFSDQGNEHDIETVVLPLLASRTRTFAQSAFHFMHQTLTSNAAISSRKRI